jgi:hypothetical protein
MIQDGHGTEPILRAAYELSGHGACGTWLLYLDLKLAAGLFRAFAVRFKFFKFYAAHFRQDVYVLALGHFQVAG